MKSLHTLLTGLAFIAAGGAFWYLGQSYFFLGLLCSIPAVPLMAAMIDEESSYRSRCVLMAYWAIGFNIFPHVVDGIGAVTAFIGGPNIGSALLRILTMMGSLFVFIGTIIVLAAIAAMIWRRFGLSAVKT